MPDSSKERRGLRTDAPMVNAIDLFCGAGGSSTAARKAGVRVLAGFDMWGIASETYKDNFPEARVFQGKLEDHDPGTIARQLPKIDLLLASPECTNHTCAKGNGKFRPESETSRATAFQVTRFAKVFKPRWIVIENVIQMRAWDRYQEWKSGLTKMGYRLTEQVLNAADFGVPQSRKRLYILCDREADPPLIKAPSRPRVPVRAILNMNGTYRYSPLRTPTRAAPTLERAERAMKVIGRDTKFLLVYYGSDASGGWQRLDVPLRTITTLDRFALVRPGKDGHLMRMLQVDELRQAMGFPASFKLRHGTRRDRIRLMGNAVCPPVMMAIIRRLLHSGPEERRLKRTGIPVDHGAREAVTA